MSSTNRGSPRVKDDAYYTPLPLAVKMLELFEQVNGGPPETVLEPSAGDGVFPFAATEVGWHDAEWACLEKRDVIRPMLPPRPDGSEFPPLSWVSGTDFLLPGVCSRSRFDLCIGNPPFSLAEAFVRKALDCSTQVMFLLRAGFLAGKKRHAMYEEHRPKNVWLLSQRPSFTGKGTDSAEYVIVHWDQRGEGCGCTKLHWLGGSWR